MAKKKVSQEKSYQELVAENERLQAVAAAAEAEKEHAYSLVEAARASRGKKQKFRIESTATPGAFHIGVAQLFTIEWLKNEYPGLVVSEDPEMVVFKTSLRQELVQRIRACFE